MSSCFSVTICIRLYILVNVFETNQTSSVVVFPAISATIRSGIYPVNGSVIIIVECVTTKVRTLKVRVDVDGARRTEMVRSANLWYHALSTALHFVRSHPHVPIPWLQIRKNEK